MGGFIQLFVALQEPLLLLTPHPARNGVPQTVFVHVFGCECVCESLCVKTKGEMEGVDLFAVSVRLEIVASPCTLHQLLSMGS